MTVLWRLFKKQIILTVRHSQQLWTTLMFFVVIVSIFPLSLNPLPSLLSQIAPGVLWMGALLSCLLAMGRLFKADYEDGTLASILMSIGGPIPFVYVTLFVHWSLFAIPILVIAPLLALLFHLSVSLIGIILITLLLGTMSVYAFGVLFSALTVTLRHSGMLLVLITLPMVLPVVIFSTSAIEHAASGVAYGAELGFLMAILSVSIVLFPVLAAGMLRLSLRDL